jgi:hypothetical protein
VRVRCLNWYDWRGTFVVGPSIMAYIIRMINGRWASGRKKQHYSCVIDDFGYNGNAARWRTRFEEDHLWMNVSKSRLAGGRVSSYLGRPRRSVWSLNPIMTKGQMQVQSNPE